MLLKISKSSFKKFIRDMIDKGGVMAIGIFCVVLFKMEKLPTSLGRISYGITAIGACGVLRYIIMDMESKKCKDLLRDLEETELMIEDNQRKNKNIKRFIATKGVLLGLQRDSSLIQDRIIRLRKQISAVEAKHDVPTSGNTTDVPQITTDADQHRRHEKYYNKNMPELEEIKRIFQQILDASDKEMPESEGMQLISLIENAIKFSQKLLGSAPDELKQIHQSVLRSEIEAMPLVKSVSKLLIEKLYEQHKREQAEKPKVSTKRSPKGFGRELMELRKLQQDRLAKMKIEQLKESHFQEKESHFQKGNDENKEKTDAKKAEKKLEDKTEKERETELENPDLLTMMTSDRSKNTRDECTEKEDGKGKQHEEAIEKEDRTQNKIKEQLKKEAGTAEHEVEEKLKRQQMDKDKKEIEKMAETEKIEESQNILQENKGIVQEGKAENKLVEKIQEEKAAENISEESRQKEQKESQLIENMESGREGKVEKDEIEIEKQNVI